MGLQAAFCLLKESQKNNQQEQNWHAQYSSYFPIYIPILLLLLILPTLNRVVVYIYVTQLFLMGHFYSTAFSRGGG